jgi:hypothetical protein
LKVLKPYVVNPVRILAMFPLWWVNKSTMSTNSHLETPVFALEIAVTEL